MKRPAVFLDRDNTLIHNDGDLGDPDQVRLMQGVAPGIASICGLGFKVVVVTNQGGVARGKYTEDDVDAVHARIEQLVAERVNGARIDRFYFCPYHPQGSVERYTREHPHRKPQPGMLLQAAEDLKLDLSQSWMIGDALRDIEAGAAAGCRTILIQTPAAQPPEATADAAAPAGASADPPPRKGRKKAAKAKVEPDFVAGNLVEAVRVIASQPKPETREEGRGRSAAARPGPAAPPPPGGKPAAARNAQQNPDRPASAPADDAPGRGRPPARPASPPRPFVPWTKQRPPEALTPEPPRAADATAQPPPTPPPPSPPPAPPPPPADPAPVSPGEPPQNPGRAEDSGPADLFSLPPTTTDAAEVSPPTVPNTPAPAAPSNRSPEPTPPPPLPTPATPPAPVESSPPPPAVDSPGSADDLARLNKTLRLVLQELRAQRGSSGEVQQLGVAAIAVQAVAFLCMLGALWMGGGEGGDGAFFRWIGVALMLQLAVIATLLFSRPNS